MIDETRYDPTDDEIAHLIDEHGGEFKEMVLISRDNLAAMLITAARDAATKAYDEGYGDGQVKGAQSARMVGMTPRHV